MKKRENMNKIIDKINSSGWSDWMFVEAYTDCVNIHVTLDYDGTRIKIICGNFMGIYWLGQWDESIIKKISVLDTGKLIDQSKEIVNKYYADFPTLGMGNKSLTDKWYQVTITFIDGIELVIVCKEIDVLENIKN